MRDWGRKIELRHVLDSWLIFKSKDRWAVVAYPLDPGTWDRGRLSEKVQKAFSIVEKLGIISYFKG